MPAPKGGAVLDRAARLAAEDKAGAGDLLVRIGDHVELALVLEPDVSRETSRAMLPLAQVAVGEALAALAPPETDVAHRWDGAILINGAVVGTVRGRMPPGTDGDVPAWLAIGVRLALPPDGVDPGRHPDRSTLTDELGPLEANDLIEAVARHWTMWLYRWETEGWASVAREWDGRSAPDQRIPTDAGDAMLLGLDEGGNAVVSSAHGARIVPLSLRWMGPA